MYGAEVRHLFAQAHPGTEQQPPSSTPHTHTPASTWPPHKGAAPSIQQRRDPAHMHLTLQQRAESQANLCRKTQALHLSLSLPPPLVSRPSSVPVKG